MRKMSDVAAMLVVGAGLVLARPIIGQGMQPVSATDQVKDDLFAGTEKFATGAKDVSEINMDQKTLGMMGGKNSFYGEKAKKLDFVVVRSYNYDKPGMYQLSDVTDYRRKLTDSSWSCMVHTQSKSDSTDICVRSSPDHETSELALITADPKSLTFIHMKGRMSLSELESMQGPATPTPPVPPLKPR